MLALRLPARDKPSREDATHLQTCDLRLVVALGCLGCVLACLGVLIGAAAPPAWAKARAAIRRRVARVPGASGGRHEARDRRHLAAPTHIDSHFQHINCRNTLQLVVPGMQPDVSDPG